MRLADIISADDGDELPRQGQPNEALFFLVSAAADVRKTDTAFTIPARHFVGEVGFVLDAPASATVVVRKGVYVRWEAARLRKALTLQPGLGRALQALMGADMSNKVALGITIEHRAETQKAPPEIHSIQRHLA